MDVQIARRFVVNGVVVDLDSGRITDTDGTDVPLRPKPYAVLACLVENANRVVSKDQLIESAWPNAVVSDDSLVQCIVDIRRMLKDTDQKVLKTVPRRGYSLLLERTTSPTVVLDAPSQTGRRLTPPRFAVIGLAVVGAAMVAIVQSLRPGDSDAPRNPLPSVAVLPFAAIGGDQVSQRLAAGLTADITTDLARFPEFEVVVQSSDPAVGNSDARAIGASLGTSYVVEGAIQRETERIRINAKLINVGTGQSLWANRWDRPNRDFFIIQAEIAEQVANRLGGGAGLIQEAGRQAAHRKPPASLTAYEYYLLGTEKLEHINKEDIEDAIRLLEQAVTLDPGLSRAWVELYHSYSLSIGFGADAATRRRMADAAARRAVELDPSDPEAHAVLGMSYGMANDFVRAEDEFETALKLAPNAAEIVIFYIAWASSFGQPERGADLVEQAIRLDPNYPMWAASCFAHAYFMAGRYTEALAMLDRQSLENYTREKWVLRAGSLAKLGRSAEARAAVDQALVALPDLTIEWMWNEPGYNRSELDRFNEVMRLAGFPSCASDAALARFERPVRLPGCEGQN
jgi:TolB-like protein/DNA-binding winged helix-turn-helix (wHTH) protein